MKNKIVKNSLKAVIMAVTLTGMALVARAQAPTPFYAVNGLGAIGTGNSISVQPSISPSGSGLLTDVFGDNRFSVEAGPDGIAGEAFLSSATNQGPGILGGVLGAVGSLNAFTITMWINMQNTTVYNNYRFIEIDKGTSITTGSADGNLVYCNFNPSPPTIQWGVNGNMATAAANIWNGAAFQPGQWYYLVITYNSGHSQIYTGGTNIATSLQYTYSQNAPGSGLVNLGSATFLMLCNRPAENRCWPGAIDNVNIYSGELNLSQLEAIRSAQCSAVSFSAASATPNPVSNGGLVNVSIKAVSFATGATINRVSLDASSVGGSSTLPLVLSGAANVYTNSFIATAPGAAALPDAATVVVTASDTAQNTNSYNVQFTIAGPSVTWSGGAAPDNTWANSRNWVGGVPELGDTVVFAGTTQTNVNMESAYSIGGITFSPGAGTFNIGSSTANTLTLSANSPVINDSTNLETLNVAVAIGDATANGVVSVQAVSNSVVLNQALADGSSGSGGFTTVGPNATILSGLNTYSGDTTINSGTLTVGAGGDLGDTGAGGVYAANIIDNGVFNYASSNSQAITGIISGSGGLSLNAPVGTILTLQNTSSEAYRGPTIVNSGELDLHFSQIANAGLYSSSSLTIGSNGTVRLFNDNSLSGYGPGVGTLPTTIYPGGLLAAGVHSTHIWGVLTLKGGALGSDGNVNTAYGTWDLDGGVAVSGGTNMSVISAQTVVPSQTGGTVFNIANGGTPSGVDLDITGSLIDGTSLADTGVIMTGGGTMRLDGVNTYAHATTISSGTFILADPGVLGGGTYAAAILNNGTLVNATGATSGGQTLSGVISGTGNVIVAGAGSALTLSAPNSYTGNTIISNGTLYLLAPGAIATSPAITVASGATFDVSEASSPSLAPNQALFGSGTVNAPNGIAAGNGAMISPSDEGVLPLGTLHVTGNLTLGSGASTAFSVTNLAAGVSDNIAVGGSLTLNYNNVRIKAPSAAASLDQTADYVLMTASSISGSCASPPAWDVAPLNAANYSIVVSGGNVKLHYSAVLGPKGVGEANPSTNALPNNSVVLTMTVTNGTGANPSILSVVANASAITGGAATPFSQKSQASGVSVWTNSIIVPNSTPLGLVSVPVTITDGNGNVAIINITFTVVSATAIWDGLAANENWDSNLNWVGGSGPGFVGANLVFAGKTGLGPVMDQDYTVSTITFSNNAGAFVLTNATDDFLALSAGGAITNNSTNSETFNLPIQLAGVGTIKSATGSGFLVLNQPVNEATLGVGVLTNAGGTNVLNALNTYSGITVVASGTLTVGAGGDLGDTGSGGVYAANIIDNGVFNYASSNSQAITGIISGSGGLSLNAPVGTILTLQNTTSEAYTGPTIVNSGELDLDFPQIQDTGLYNSTSLAIGSNGTVRLFNDNSLSGWGPGVGTLPTTVYPGGLLASGVHSTHIWGVLTLKGGTLGSDGNVNTAYGTWDLDGGVVVSGGTNMSVISAQTVVPSQTGGTVFNIANGGTPSGVDLDITGSLIDGTSLADAGVIMIGTGTMRLDGLNTYAGKTTISNGTFIVADPGVLGGGTYAAAILNNGTLINATGATSGGQTLSGVISGTGNVIVAGAGSALTLSAPNSYTGNTIISNGTLYLLDPGAIGNSALIDVQSGGTLDVSGISGFTVNAGQTLRGTGSILQGGNVITVNGTLSAGEANAVGALILNGDLTMTGTSQISLRINKTGHVLTSDRIAGIGNGTYAGTLMITNTGTGYLAPGDSFTLFGATAGSGNFSSIVGPPGYTFTFNPTTGVLTVATVPPTTPTKVACSLSGKTLTLSWPAAYIGSTLQSNSISLAKTNDWFNVPGSASVTNVNITIGSGNVFFRLLTP